MKKFALGFIAFMLVIAVVATGDSVAEEKRLYESVVETLKSESRDFDDPITTWKVREKCNKKCLDPDFTKPKWKTTGWGYYWIEQHRKVYFRWDYEVPERVADREIAGSQAYLFIQCEDDAEVYVEGELAGSVHRDGEIFLGDNVQPGQVIRITMFIKNKTSPGLMRYTSVRYSKLDEIKQRTSQFISQVESISSFIEYADDPGHWEDLLDRAASKVDLDAYLDQDDGKYFASLDATNEVFKEFKPFFDNYDIYLIAYSHIDLAWLWDWAEGEIVTRDTSRTMMQMMEKYPNFVYAQTQAHGYKWMEDDYPEIFEEIKKWYKAGRWELLGGTWSEHDSNVPSGEGMVRQFLYGKRYFREKFDKDIIVAWTPDSFGYNWNLPQLITKSGCIGFLTQKINWNDTTRFPHHIFWWEGPDGSRVLTYFPVGGYGEYVHGPTMLRQMKRIIEKHNVNENFVIFGVGDHGGGVTRGHLERARALENNPAYPEIHYTTAEDYFKHLHDVAESHEANIPVWKDELYLEYHRGTYTTQAETKKNNRQLEILMENAEKFAATAGLVDPSRKYPSEDIFGGWYWVLLNHMHDILPGSGIRAVYEDADRDYAKTRKLGNSVLSGALETIAAKIDTSGEGVPMILFNPLSWKRDGVVKTSFDGMGETTRVINEKGQPVPCQIIDEGGVEKLLFVAKDIPAIGYAVYRVLPEGGSPQGRGPRAGDGFIENDLLKVTYDTRTGRVTGLVDKRNGNREVLDAEKGSNYIQVYEDHPSSNDAWNIALGDELRLDRAAAPEIVEAGPVRATVKYSYQVGIDSFDQYVSLINGMPMMYGRIEADWQERHRMAKLAFNFDIENDTVWYNIPYAAIPRKSIPETLAEKAKTEHCGQKWADFSEKDGSFGVTIVDNGKYGYDANHSRIRMSLLRAPTEPDPIADKGHHEIEYALAPHAGNWQDGHAPRAGYEFNYPLIPLITDIHEGSRPVSGGFFSVEPAGAVALTVVKKAEDDSSMVLRIVELEGRDTTARIALPFEPSSVTEVNLIEDPMQDYDPIDIDGGSINVPMGHHEIKTLKLGI